MPSRIERQAARAAARALRQQQREQRQRERQQRQAERAAQRAIRQANRAERQRTRAIQRGRNRQGYLHPSHPCATPQDVKFFQERRRLRLQASGAEIEFVTTDGNLQMREANTATFNAALPADHGPATYSFWVNIPTASVANTGSILTFESGFQDRVLFRVNGSEQVTVNAATTAGAAYINNQAVTIPLDENVHCMLGFNAATGVAEFWVNGTREINDTGNTPGFAFDTGQQAGINIGSDRAGNQHLDADISFGDIWVGAEYVSDPTGVFIDAAGNPLDGGADGSGYTGSQPLVYLKTVTDFTGGSNRGSAGDLTIATGTVSAA